MRAVMADAVDLQMIEDQIKDSVEYFISNHSDEDYPPMHDEEMYDVLGLGAYDVKEEKAEELA